MSKRYNTSLKKSLKNGSHFVYVFGSHFGSIFGWPGSGWLGCAGPGLAGAGLVEAATGVAGANMGLGLAWE